MARQTLKTVALLLLIGSTLGGFSPNPWSRLYRNGQKRTINKTLTTPDAPTRLDLLLLIDTTGSYGDDLRTIRGIAGSLFDDIDAAVDSLRIGVASFRDHFRNGKSWASSGDYDYRLDQALTTSKAAFIAAINGLVAGGGNDGPESQYIGLSKAALDGAVGWDNTRNKVIAITTDNSFHTNEACSQACGNAFDADYPIGQSDAHNDLNGENISVIAIKAPGSGFQMDEVAAATGGAVVTTSSNSAQIATAIVAGLRAITYNVRIVIAGCDKPGVNLHTISPTSFNNVPGNTVLHLTEMLRTRRDRDCSNGPITCLVKAFGNGALLDTQRAIARCCPAGTFLSGDECKRCKIGYYCPGTGSPVPCPWGTTTTGGADGPEDCTPIKCDRRPRKFEHDECDQWIARDHPGIPNHGLLLRNLYPAAVGKSSYTGFTFNNGRTNAVGNQVKAFVVFDYCADTKFKLEGLVWGGRLKADGSGVVRSQAESCWFEMDYTTWVERSGPADAGIVRVKGGSGHIDCPSFGRIDLKGKRSGGHEMLLHSKYIHEYKGNGWLRYPRSAWRDPRYDPNSTPQDLDFIPRCPLPHPRRGAPAPIP